MGKIKRLLFLLAIVFALVMTSCSSQKHKKYIPADSKVLGKVDLKAFFDQSDVDKDKLIEDIKDAIPKDAKKEFEKLEEMGLDVDVPIYFFARGGAQHLAVEHRVNEVGAALAGRHRHAPVPERLKKTAGERRLAHPTCRCRNHEARRFEAHSAPPACCVPGPEATMR